VLGYAEVQNAKSVLTAGLRWKAWSRRVEVVGA
jgi:hypothetical protein